MTADPNAYWLIQFTDGGYTKDRGTLLQVVTRLSTRYPDNEIKSIQSTTNP